MGQATLHREAGPRVPARPAQWQATGDLVPGRDPTPRMMELVERMANGRTQKEAARELGGLSESGVRRLARVARERLGARTDPQMVAEAIHKGLLVAISVALVVGLQALELAQVTSPIEGTEVARRMPGGRRHRGGERTGRKDARGSRAASRKDDAGTLALDADDLALQLAADRGDTWDQLPSQDRQRLTVAVHVEAEQWMG